MDSLWPIMMLVLCGFFIGGVISFAKAKIIVLAVACGIAAVMCGVAAVLWWGV
jgi:hypothetical protein